MSTLVQAIAWCHHTTSHRKIVVDWWNVVRGVSDKFYLFDGLQCLAPRPCNHFTCTAGKIVLHPDPLHREVNTKLSYSECLVDGDILISVWGPRWGLISWLLPETSEIDITNACNFQKFRFIHGNRFYCFLFQDKPLTQNALQNETSFQTFGEKAFMSA